ncbi:hypothetical protein H0N98_02235 [Candidatus Micrarchaeota archaeon]|nr:hypothetical protein [Candidatus Micrarchaeota archaeon]
MFWVVWLSLTLIFISSIIGIYSWNGILLELVKIKTAKKLWVISAVMVLIGLLLFIWSIATIVNTPSLVDKFSTFYTTSPPVLVWTAVFLLLLGGFIIGVPTQLYQLKFTKLSKDMRNNLFYVGMLLLVLSVILLIWLLMPGNQLPA